MLRYDADINLETKQVNICFRWKYRPGHPALCANNAAAFVLHMAAQNWHTWTVQKNIEHKPKAKLQLSSHIVRCSLKSHAMLS